MRTADGTARQDFRPCPSLFVSPLLFRRKMMPNVSAFARSLVNSGDPQRSTTAPSALGRACQRHRQCRRGPVLASVVALISCWGPQVEASTLDYTHWAESGLVMLLWDLLYREANVVWYGESSSPGVDQYALLIAEDADAQDDGEKNVVLFECGMHAREWYAAESCFWLADYLLDNRRDPLVEELLDHVDVWIIPHSNPAGRDEDDPALGDPTAYTWYCSGGSNAGDVCNTDSDCPGVANGCYQTGWRGNANTASCYAGVDLARNWSSGWNSASATCDPTDFRKFRGDAPFSEPEARNLRTLVHNRMISMAAVVHANSQKVGHHWNNSSSAAAWIQDELKAVNDAAVAAWGDPDVALTEAVTGTGVGQFSGWLTGTSDVGGELDEGTERNIPVVFFELPVASSHYAPPYEEAPGDGSNGFHPSGEAMEDLYEQTLRDLFVEVIRQARSPSCPVDASGARVTSQCASNDFGLTGAKIADDVSSVGILSVDEATREETAPPGEHEIVFAVQNASAGSGLANTDVTVTVERNGTVVATYTVPVSLNGGDRGVYSVRHVFGLRPFAQRYKVTIALDNDDYAKNNTTSFAFRVDPIFSAPWWQHIPGFATPVFELPEKRRLRVSTVHLYEVATPVFPNPMAKGVELTFIARGTGKDGRDLTRTLSLDGRGWRKTDAGGWAFTSRSGPVRSLTIANAAATPKQPAQTMLEMDIRGGLVDDLHGAVSWTVDTAFPEHEVVLRALATAEAPNPQRPFRGVPRTVEEVH
jgi:hypothetical protein